jgi:transcriptional regulator with XRE-family HTH domain
MFEFIKQQLAHLYLKNSLQRDNVFNESKLVYFATGPEDEGGTEEPAAPEAKEEAAEEAEHDETMQNISAITSNVVESSFSLLDKWKYNLPPDIDPDRIDKARDIVNKATIAIEQEKESFTGMQEFLNAIGAESDEKKKEELWGIVFGVVPEVNRLREKKQFSQSEISAVLGLKLVPKLKKFWRANSEKSPKAAAINKAHSDFIQIIERLAEHEFEIYKTLNEVQTVMWDMHNQRQVKEINERAIRGAEGLTGLDLKKDSIFEGIDREIINWNAEGGQPETKEYKKVKFRLLDIGMDKKRVPDPETAGPQEKNRMMGMYVAIENQRTGQVYRLKIDNFKEFANLHRLKPKVKNKKILKEKVNYLSEMNIDLHAGMKLEYNDWVLDEKSQRRKPQPKTVTIKYLDDKSVQLDQAVTTYSPFDNPDPQFHETTDTMDLGEFAKWLNKRKALPEILSTELQAKMDEHYEYMNAKYNRKPECHRAINLEKGEVVFADAPGNPLFEIAEVTPSMIQLTNGRKFTMPQFLRWVYEFDMEPYDPALEGMKVRKYFDRQKAEKKFLESLDDAAKRAEEEADATIDHFRNTGTWRDTLKKLKEKGLEGIHEGPKVPLKEDAQNDVQRQSHSWMRQFINDTEVLRLDDIFEMFKMGWEYKKRNWERKQKARYSKIGKGVPWFGTEFERINQQSENEEVNQFKESMDQWGVRDIQETLYATKNSDQAKACLNVLAEKGQIRWDDPRLWEAINNHTDINHKIPKPLAGMDPYMPFKEGTGLKFNGVDIAGKSAIDFIPEALDSIWGESSYINWKRQNDGALEDGIQKSFNKAEELESDPKNVGGIGKELGILLERHMRGEYVDPSEFEGMLRFIIEAGKAGGQHKMYYLLMGTSAKDPTGRTIMGWDRVGRFISKYSNQFPPLDYFSASNQAPKRDLTTGELFTRQWVRQDFDKLTKPWVDQIHANGGKVTGPTPGSWDFLWKEVCTSDAFQIRLEKGIRAAQNMDHDDSPFFIPALKETEIETACAASGGETKKFTVQGYKNGYIGFGLRLKYLQEKVEEEKKFENAGEVGFSNQHLAKMVASFRSYVRYDAILDYRYRRTEESRLQRFSSNDFKTGCVWDGEHAIQDYRDEMQSLIQEVIKAYGRQDDKDLSETPFERQPSVKGNKGMKQKQEKIEAAVQNWGPEFERMVMSDGGKKFTKIIGKHSFKFDKVGEMSDAQKMVNKMDMSLFEADRKEIVDSEY